MPNKYKEFELHFGCHVILTHSHPEAYVASACSIDSTARPGLGQQRLFFSGFLLLQVSFVFFFLANMPRWGEHKRRMQCTNSTKWKSFSRLLPLLGNHPAHLNVKVNFTLSTFLSGALQREYRPRGTKYGDPTVCFSTLDIRE